jgi:hypothetical protein
MPIRGGSVASFGPKGNVEAVKITNTYGLPQPFVDAVTYDDYQKGQEPSDFSTTGLLRPARIAALSKANWDKMEEDASERVWRLSGQAKHMVLERIGKQNPTRYRIEERLYTEFEGFKLSGQIDLLDREDSTLYDWKETSVWKVIVGDQIEWEQQANINFWLARRNGIEVKRLCNIAFLKDWKKRQAVKKDYPPVGIQACPLPIWGTDKTEAFIRERIAAHVEARIKLPDCTPAERWDSPHVFAVKKKGTKRAMNGGLHDTLEAAERFAGTIALPTEIEERLGESVRCLFYCPVVAFCSYGREQLQAQSNA